MQGLQKPCHPGSDQVRDLCRKTQGPETQELRPPENYGRGRINPEADLKSQEAEAPGGYIQAKRQEAKSLGLCVTCWTPTIPGETKCKPCTELHQKYRRQAKEGAIQQRDQASGQASFL